MENKSLTCHTTSERRLIDVLDEIRKIQEVLDEHQNEADSVAYMVFKSVKTALEQAPTVDAVELPCRMGDIVWGIQKHIRGFQPKQGVVNQMYFGEDMQLCICVKNICRGEWGKKVFATKEEADAALAKMDGGNEDDKSIL